MIFNFRLVSDEVNNFKREIKIDARATFLDFKNAICDSVGYKKDDASSFFLCGDRWEKEREIAYEDMGSRADEDVYLMDECVLEDYIDDEGQKLLFTFDYEGDRSFYLEMKELITGKDLLDPVCTLSLGNPPSQYIEKADDDVKESSGAAKKQAATLEDFDEDMYGTDEYDPDEYDAGGFSELTED